MSGQGLYVGGLRASTTALLGRPHPAVAQLWDLEARTLAAPTHKHTRTPTHTQTHAQKNIHIQFVA